MSPDLLSGWEHLGTAVVQFCVSTRVARASLQLSFAGGSGVAWWVGPAGEGGTLSGSVPGTMGMGAGYGPKGCSGVLGQAWMGSCNSTLRSRGQTHCTRHHEGLRSPGET